MIFLNGQFIIVYTCKPHINHKYSLVIKSLRVFSVQKCCISADEKDRYSIFTTVATIWKPGFRVRSGIRSGIKIGLGLEVRVGARLKLGFVNV
jgi:hypothetical protein